MFDENSENSDILQALTDSISQSKLDKKTERMSQIALAKMYQHSDLDINSTKASIDNLSQQVVNDLYANDSQILNLKIAANNLGRKSILDDRNPHLGRSTDYFIDPMAKSPFNNIGDIIKLKEGQTTSLINASNFETNRQQKLLQNQINALLLQEKQDALNATKDIIAKKISDQTQDDILRTKLSQASLLNPRYQEDFTKYPADYSLTGAVKHGLAEMGGGISNLAGDLINVAGASIAGGLAGLAPISSLTDENGHTKNRWEYMKDVAKDIYKQSNPISDGLYAIGSAADRYTERLNSTAPYSIEDLKAIADDNFLGFVSPESLAALGYGFTHNIAQVAPELALSAPTLGTSVALPLAVKGARAVQIGRLANNTSKLGKAASWATQAGKEIPMDKIGKAAMFNLKTGGAMTAIKADEWARDAEADIQGVDKISGPVDLSRMISNIPNAAGYVALNAVDLGLVAGGLKAPLAKGLKELFRGSGKAASKASNEVKDMAGKVAAKKASSSLGKQVLWSGTKWTTRNGAAIGTGAIIGYYSEAINEYWQTVLELKASKPTMSAENIHKEALNAAEMGALLVAFGGGGAVAAGSVKQAAFSPFYTERKIQANVDRQASKNNFAIDEIAQEFNNDPKLYQAEIQSIREDSTKNEYYRGIFKRLTTTDDMSDVSYRDQRMAYDAANYGAFGSEANIKKQNTIVYNNLKDMYKNTPANEIKAKVAGMTNLEKLMTQDIITQKGFLMKSLLDSDKMFSSQENVGENADIKQNILNNANGLKAVISSLQDNHRFSATRVAGLNSFIDDISDAYIKTLDMPNSRDNTRSLKETITSFLSDGFVDENGKQRASISDYLDAAINGRLSEANIRDLSNFAAGHKNKAIGFAKALKDSEKFFKDNPTNNVMHFAVNKYDGKVYIHKDEKKLIKNLKDKSRWFLYNKNSPYYINRNNTSFSENLLANIEKENSIIESLQNSIAQIASAFKAKDNAEANSAPVATEINEREVKDETNETTAKNMADNRPPRDENRSDDKFVDNEDKSSKTEAKPAKNEDNNKVEPAKQEPSSKAKPTENEAKSEPNKDENENSEVAEKPINETNEATKQATPKNTTLDEAIMLDEELSANVDEYMSDKAAKNNSFKDKVIDDPDSASTLKNSDKVIDNNDLQRIADAINIKGFKKLTVEAITKVFDKVFPDKKYKRTAKSDSTGDYDTSNPMLALATQTNARTSILYRAFLNTANLTGFKKPRDRSENEKYLKKLFGKTELKPIGEIFESMSDAQKKAFKKGVLRTDLAEQIGREVLKDLGLKINSELTPAQVSNTRQELGLYVIKTMEKLGLVENVGISKNLFSDKLNAKKINFIVPTEKLAINGKDVYDVLNKIAEEFNLDYKETSPNYYTKPQKPFTNYIEVKGVGMVKVSDAVRDSLNAAANINYQVSNINAYRSILASEQFVDGLVEVTMLNDDSIYAMYNEAFGENKWDKMNEKDKEGFTAKQEQLKKQIESLKDIVDNNPEAIFFEVFEGKNDRSMNRGVANPKDNKMTRFVLYSRQADTSYTYKVDDKGEYTFYNSKNEDVTNVVLTNLAQSFGFSTDKKSIAENEKVGKDLIAMSKKEDLLKAVTYMIYKKIPSKTLSRDGISIDIELTHPTATINAAMFLEFLKKAEARKDNSFEAVLIGESDGITNGIANKHSLFIFSPASIDAAAKAGIVYGDTQKAVDVYDNYKELAFVTSKQLNAHPNTDIYPNDVAGNKDIIDSVNKSIEDNTSKSKYQYTLGNLNKEQVAVAYANLFQYLKGSLALDENGKVTSKSRSMVKPIVNLFNYSAGDTKNIEDFSKNLLEDLLSTHYITTTLFNSKDNNQRAKITAEMNAKSMLLNKFLKLNNITSQKDFHSIYNHKGRAYTNLLKSFSTISESIAKPIIVSALQELHPGLFNNNNLISSVANRNIQNVADIFNSVIDDNTEMTNKEYKKLFNAVKTLLPSISFFSNSPKEHTSMPMQAFTDRTLPENKDGETQGLQIGFGDGNAKYTPSAVTSPKISQFTELGGAPAVLYGHMQESGIETLSNLALARNGEAPITTIYDAFVATSGDMLAATREFNKNSYEVSKSKSSYRDSIKQATINKIIALKEGNEVEIKKADVALKALMAYATISQVNNAIKDHFDHYSANYSNNYANEAHIKDDGINNIEIDIRNLILDGNKYLGETLMNNINTILYDDRVKTLTAKELNTLLDDTLNDLNSLENINEHLEYVNYRTEGRVYISPKSINNFTKRIQNEIKYSLNKLSKVDKFKNTANELMSIYESMLGESNKPAKTKADTIYNSQENRSQDIPADTEVKASFTQSVKDDPNVITNILNDAIKADMAENSEINSKEYIDEVTQNVNQILGEYAKSIGDLDITINEIDGDIQAGSFNETTNSINLHRAPKTLTGHSSRLETTAHEMIHSATTLALKDSSFIRGMQKVHSRLMEELTPEMIAKELNTGSEATNLQYANTIFKHIESSDINGLAELATMAVTNPAMMRVLKNIEYKNKESKAKNWYERIKETLYGFLADTYNRLVNNIKIDASIYDAILHLDKKMAEVNQLKKTTDSVYAPRGELSLAFSALLDSADAKGSVLADAFLTKMDKIIDKKELQEEMFKHLNPEGFNQLSRWGKFKLYSKIAIKSARDSEIKEHFLLLLDKTAFGKYDGVLQTVINDASKINKNKEIAETLQLLSDRIDGKYLMDLQIHTNEYANDFDNKLDEADRANLERLVLDTDMQSLLGSYDVKQISEFLNDREKLQAHIKELESEVLTNIVKDANFKSRKLKVTPREYSNFVNIMSDELANYMITGVARHPGLLLNAYNIANMIGYTNIQKLDVDSSIVERIDRLTTLKALNMLDDSQTQFMDKLNKEFNKNLTGFLTNIQTQHQKSMSELFDDNPIQTIKGYKFEKVQNHISYKIADLKDIKDLEIQGFRRVYDDNINIQNDPLLSNKALFVNDSIFNSDISLNRAVYKYSGSNSRGITLKDIANNTVIDENSTDDIKSMLNNSFNIQKNRARNFYKQALTGKVTDKHTSNVVAIFSPEGRVADMRFMFSYTTKQTELQMKEDAFATIAQSIVSRNAKVSSKSLNKDANQALADIYFEAKKAMQEEQEAYNKARLTDKPMKPSEMTKMIFFKQGFVEFSEKSPDKAVASMYAMLSDDIKADLKERFKDETPMIPKELVMHMLGFKDFDIKNLELYKNANKITRSVLSISQKLLKKITSALKEKIVIKTPQVISGNFMNNTLQLVNDGLTLRESLQRQVEAIADIESFQKTYKDYQKLLHQRDSGVKGLDTRIKTLAKTANNSKIFPLIKAGLFTTISEDFSRQDNDAFDNKVDEIYNKLPKPVQITLDSLFVSKRTDLNKALTFLVHRSDLVARIVMYDHNIKQGMPHKEAIKKTLDAFINYSTHIGKTRKFAEDHGFVWFSKYFLRIQRVIHNDLLAKKPVRALGLIMAQNLFNFDVDDVYDVSFINKNYSTLFSDPFTNAMNLASPITLDVLK